MIMSQLNLASIQDGDSQEIMRRLFVKQLQKLSRDFGLHATIIQLGEGRLPTGVKYRWLGNFLALLSDN